MNSTCLFTVKTRHDAVKSMSTLFTKIRHHEVINISFHAIIRSPIELSDGSKGIEPLDSIIITICIRLI